MSKTSQGTVFYQLTSWTIVMFLGVVYVLLILRIYAMYNQSRRILVVLLVIYIPVLVNITINVALYNTHTTYVSVINLEVVDIKFCDMAYKSTILEAILLLIPQLIFNILICSLAVGKFVTESLQMHQAVKQWRLNRFLELFARESILFFSVYVRSFLSLAKVTLTSRWRARTLLSLVDSIFPYVLAPRFIISVRELHSNMIGGHVDTGFGVVSKCTSINHNIVFASAGEMPARGADMAADVGTGEGDARGVVYELAIKMEESQQLAVLSGSVASEPTLDIFT
ncbi:hypothetical protein BU15DRAFT_78375 [Melanogaster broomeanus]|nr:hypothetical protein BU15DRAFT_78375 [Melanogaster broomeanus]